MNFLSRKLCMLVPCIMMLSSTYNVNSMENDNKSINSQQSGDQIKEYVIEAVKENETENNIINITNKEKQTLSIDDLYDKMVADRNVQSKKRRNSINYQHKNKYQKSEESGKNNINDNEYIIEKEDKVEKGKNASFDNLDVSSQVATMDVLAPEKETIIIENLEKPELKIENIDKISMDALAKPELEIEYTGEMSMDALAKPELEIEYTGEMSMDALAKPELDNDPIDAIQIDALAKPELDNDPIDAIQIDALEKPESQICHNDYFMIQSETQQNKEKEIYENPEKKIEQLTAERESLLDDMISVLNLKTQNKQMKKSDKKQQLEQCIQYLRENNCDISNMKAVASSIDEFSKKYSTAVFFNISFLADYVSKYIKLTNESDALQQQTSKNSDY